jgi:hypothetical protein
MKQIELSQGKVALVDDEDFEYLSQWKWCVLGNRGKRYAFRRAGGKGVLMHRIISNAPPDMVVDHIDGNGLNNQKGNLRVCTNTENVRNQTRIKNGYKGVSRDKQAWRSRIFVNKKFISLGRYDTPEEAAKAYDKAARKFFGVFARPNFPGGAK